MAITQQRNPDVVEFRFPGGKDKALTFSYDDGQVYDRKLVDIFNRYGVKGTFHLNSGVLGQEGFVARGEIKELYHGHEVACHSVTHPFFSEIAEGQMLREILEDRRILEQDAEKIVRGFSYPFGEYGEALIGMARSLGIVYARTVEDTMSFNLPTDFMVWNPTCHHNKVTEELMDDYLNPPAYRKLALFYIWGHSYEFGQQDNWEHMEHICEKLGGKESVWYATNMEIYEYITAMRSVVFSADGDILYNPSATPVYMLAGEKEVCLAAGEAFSLHRG